MVYKASQDIATLLRHFDPNVNMGDELDSSLSALSEESREFVKKEFQMIMRDRIADTDFIYKRVFFYAKDNEQARRFIEDVYKYAFEGGEEPYISDYQ